MAGVTPTPIVALDYPDIASAIRMVETLGDLCRFYKVGSELFTAEGPQIVRAVQAKGADVFLDLKFHDIPNTVRSAVRSASALGVALITVHAAGGPAMIEAAVQGAAEAGSHARILAVTILTSLDRSAIGSVWGRPVSSMEAEVLRLAGVAAGAGAHGVVCSGQEAAAIRDGFGAKLATLVPGIRLAGGAHQDQARVVTPRQAREAGARYIVLGRAITGAGSPRDVMSEVLADLS